MSVSPIIVALAFALGLWWFSTGAILWLVRSPRTANHWILVVASLMAIIAVGALIATRDEATPATAFTAFTSAVVIWGWHELSFLTGVVTGASSATCPAGAKGWARFRAAAATLMHHELALAITALAVAAFTLGHANPIGGLTFLVLFVARLSSKLNLFFGVPNFSAEFFPARLAYLTTYLRKAPVTALFPLSLAGLTLAAAAAATVVLDADVSPFAATGYALVFALLALAAVEHAFMVLPIRDTALWRWALPTPERSEPRVAVLADPIETPE